jgi:hypothetical protein
MKVFAQMDHNETTNTAWNVFCMLSITHIVLMENIAAVSDKFKITFICENYAQKQITKF